MTGPRHYSTKRRKSYPRGAQPNKHFPGQPGLGTFQCNICSKDYTRHSKFDRFCSQCRSKLWCRGTPNITIGKKIWKDLKYVPIVVEMDLRAMNSRLKKLSFNAKPVIPREKFPMTSLFHKHMKIRIGWGNQVRPTTTDHASIIPCFANWELFLTSFLQYWRRNLGGLFPPTTPAT